MSSSASTGRAAAAGAPSRLFVLLLCWLVVVFDGYDLIVYGAVVPKLLVEPGWDLTPSTAGTIGSLAFLGMLVGALTAGWVADRLGRRTTVIAATVLFSAATAACALAPSPEMFAVLRLVAGLGLGGVVPSANALVAEFAGPRQRAMTATLMMSGIPIGGSLAALIGIRVIPAWGWRPMFALALVGLVVLVPLLLAKLPESAAFQRSRQERAARAEAGRAERPPGIFAPEWRWASILFAAATVATLFAWYGLGTWLPQLMRQSGFDLGPALAFTLALNLGAVAGSLLTGWAGGHFGSKRVAGVAAAVAGVGLLLMVTTPAVGWTYLVFVLAGVGTHGTQCLTIAAVANHYPDALRGRALGWMLGMGRIGAVIAPQLGGLLLDNGYGVGANFVVFGAASLVAAVLLVLTPRPPAELAGRTPTERAADRSAVTSSMS
jgi:AAHS family benzoate transporter-like MFS transporter